MTQRFVVVTNVCGAFFGRLFEAESTGADRYSIAILKLLLKVWFTVYEYFVSTSAKLAVDYCTVDYSKHSAIVSLDMCVITGSARIVEHHSVVGRAANC